MSPQLETDLIKEWLQGKQIEPTVEPQSLPFIDWQRNIIGDEPNPWYKFHDVPDSSSASKEAISTPPDDAIPLGRERIVTPDVFKESTANSPYMSPENISAAVRKATRLMNTREIIKFNKVMELAPDTDPVELALSILSESMPKSINLKPLILNSEE